MEIRLNEDGSLDEVVGKGSFHLEQMDRDVWFLEIDGMGMMLETNTEAHITATPRDYNAWSEAERVLVQQDNLTMVQHNNLMTAPERQSE